MHSSKNINIFLEDMAHPHRVTPFAELATPFNKDIILNVYWLITYSYISEPHFIVTLQCDCILHDIIIYIYFSIVYAQNFDGDEI